MDDYFDSETHLKNLVAGEVVVGTKTRRGAGRVRRDATALDK